jgi:hypothetical protein
MVGGERGGPLRTICPSGYSARRSSCYPDGLSKGQGHLGCPPIPQAPQGRGAQRGSRDAERPEAFIRMFLVLTSCEEAFQNLVKQDQS